MGVQGQAWHLPQLFGQFYFAPTTSECEAAVGITPGQLGVGAQTIS